MYLIGKMLRAAKFMLTARTLKRKVDTFDRQKELITNQGDWHNSEN
jgi:hypothetical protein